MEPLFFDSPAETDVVRRFPTTAKFFLCPPLPKFEPETSRSATARSRHSATEALVNVRKMCDFMTVNLIEIYKCGGEFTL